jgi:hypothetical protein
VTQLINNIYKPGERSSDFAEVAIALKKEQKATKCSDHRTISIIAHIAQILARILKGRIERKTEDTLGEDLFGLEEEKRLQIQLG